MLTHLYRKISHTTLNAKSRRLGRDAIQDQLESARQNIKVGSPPKKGNQSGKRSKNLISSKQEKEIFNRDPSKTGKSVRSSSLAEVNPPRINPAFALPAPGAVPGIFGVGNGILPIVPPGSVVSPKGALDHVINVAENIGGKAATVATAFDALNALDKSTNRLVSNKVKDVIKNNRGKRGGGSGGPSNNNNNTGRGGISYNMMCDKPTSEKIDLITGVRSGLIVNPGEPTNSEDFSDLYLMSGNLLKKDSIPTSFSDYIKNVIFPEVATRIQFNLNYSYQLTINDFENWFYSLTLALEIYYTLDSVIAFNDNRENTNSGCRTMRGRISSQTRLRLNLLRDVLGKQPIPPKVLHLVRYMYQHFKFSELPGSPIYRLVPGNTFNDGASPSNEPYFGKLTEGMIIQVTTNLTSFSPTYNKIYQAIPEWHVPNSCMPPSCNEAYYDAGFRTFWFNAGMTFKVGNETKFTRTLNQGQSFRYWLYTNNFDGVYFAMSSFNKTNEPGVRPGIWSPVISYMRVNENKDQCSALCYQENGTFTPIYKPETSRGLRAYQYDNYCVPIWDEKIGWVLINNQDGSTQVAQECTFDTWKQAVYNTSAWMFQ
jgi:hypothetical protein